MIGQTRGLPFLQLIQLFLASFVDNSKHNSFSTKLQLPELPKIASDFWIVQDRKTPEIKEKHRHPGAFL
jgi:hypothetical protein